MAPPITAPPSPNSSCPVSSWWPELSLPLVHLLTDSVPALPRPDEKRGGKLSLKGERCSFQIAGSLQGTEEKPILEVESSLPTLSEMGTGEQKPERGEGRPWGLLSQGGPGLAGILRKPSGSVSRLREEDSKGL